MLDTIDERVREGTDHRPAERRERPIAAIDPLREPVWVLDTPDIVDLLRWLLQDREESFDLYFNAPKGYR